MACRAPGASSRLMAPRIRWWARSDRGGHPGSPSELCRVSLIGTARPTMKSASSGLRAAGRAGDGLMEQPVAFLAEAVRLDVGGHEVERTAHLREVFSVRRAAASAA